MGTVARGWTLDAIAVVRSGQPFSIFDTSQQTLDLSAPRAAFTGAHPTKRNTYVASSTPDVFHLITFYPAQILRQPNVLTPGAQWPGGHVRERRVPGAGILESGLRAA